MSLLDPEIAEALAAAPPYIEPAQLGHPWGRSVRLPPRVPIVESYATQVHTQILGGERLVLAPTDAPVPAYDDTVGNPLKFLLTAWNPMGGMATYDSNESDNRSLRAGVAQAGGVVSAEFVTTPPDRSWVEETLVVEGITREQAKQFAFDFCQPAFTIWTPECLHIEPSGRMDTMWSQRFRYSTELVPRTCPMRTDDEPGAKCVRRGGPWTSGSITASALWQEHRRELLRGLGCDACDDGREPTLGPLGAVRGSIPVGDRNLLVANRYGGYAWTS